MKNVSKKKLIRVLAPSRDRCAFNSTSFPKEVNLKNGFAISLRTNMAQTLLLFEPVVLVSKADRNKPNFKFKFE